MLFVLWAKGPFPDEERALLHSYLRIVRLRLGEIARRILHKLGHGDLIYEAVGLALKLRIDGAVGLHVLAKGKAHRAPVTELAGHGHSRRGHTKQESARNGGLEINSSPASNEGRPVCAGRCVRIVIDH